MINILIHTDGGVVSSGNCKEKTAIKVWRTKMHFDSAPENDNPCFIYINILQ